VVYTRLWNTEEGRLLFRGKDVDEINQLKREGLSILAISELTGYDRKTIRKYLLKPTAQPVYAVRPAAARKLEPFQAYLGERLQAGVWNARVFCQCHRMSYPDRGAENSASR
jgi:transposase